MEIITKAKKSHTAYEKPSPRKPNQGRPPKKGAAVHLKELFASHAKQFRKAKIELYGKQESIRYYSIDLLWGQGLYQELRFVLVEMGGIQSILASTSLELNPLAIIRLYSLRFRIECTFMELKQQIGAFCYHFWSKSLPKLSYYQKKGSPSPMERVKNVVARENIKKAIRATEMHMQLACIAMGILQCLSIHFKGQIDACQIRYQRTSAKEGDGLGRCSHEFFQKGFFTPYRATPGLRITQIIQKQQEKSGIYWDSLAS